ncbi:hypothetical protein J2X32_003118 [Rheinheimera pacifica]|uniref:hypothetical protein n=1 Tax=Rheinheimera pacifica TaxID=173990 RepID=UPI00285B22D3|nr:hypothetical protein [Rheinheimera pacifica]MDR6984474.1 hypothetical protein [Rheinheimera pacifica]
MKNCKFLNLALMLMFFSHLFMSTSAFSASLLDIPLEDVLRRASYIGVIDVDMLAKDNEKFCSGIVVGKDVTSDKKIQIVLPNTADVKNSGKYFAVLRKADVSNFHGRKNCFTEKLAVFTASAGYQTIFPFGNGVAYPENVILFRRASIFSSSRIFPDNDFVTGFYIEPDGIFGAVDFSLVVRHICSNVFNLDTSGVGFDFCQNNKGLK